MRNIQLSRINASVLTPHLEKTGVLAPQTGRNASFSPNSRHCVEIVEQRGDATGIDFIAKNQAPGKR
jgi:hypothetical protein